MEKRGRVMGQLITAGASDDVKGADKHPLLNGAPDFGNSRTISPSFQRVKFRLLVVSTGVGRTSSEPRRVKSTAEGREYQ